MVANKRSRRGFTSCRVRTHGWLKTRDLPPRRAVSGKEFCGGRRGLSLLQYGLGDRLELHVGGALIDRSDLGVAIELLDRIVLGVAVSAEQLHAERGDAFRDL